MSFTRIAVLLSVTALLAGCVLPFPKGTEVHQNQSYGAHQRNKLDVFLPEQRDTSTETVVLIHGGAWVAGDKAGEELKGIRNRLLGSGFAVASMNYRYACGDHLKQMEDVGNALQHLSENAAQWNINSQRFALLGFSAGGHLALLHGHAFNQNGLVRTVISNVGPTDLTDPLLHQSLASYGIMYTLEQLLGATYAEDSALYAQASPVFSPSQLPTLLLYGALDDLVPKEQGIVMFDTLSAFGAVVDTTIPTLGTHNIYGPNNMYRDQLENEIIDWLHLHLNE